MPKALQIHQTHVDKATFQGVKIQDRIDLGQVKVGQASAKQVQVSLRPGKIRIKDVQLKMDLSASVKWTFKLNLGVTKVDESGTIGLPPIHWQVALPDANIPDISTTDEFKLSIDEMNLGSIGAMLDPILGAQVGEILMGAVIKDIMAGNIVLPAGGFTLAGLGLGSMSLGGLSLPALQVGQTQLGTVSGKLPIPRMTLSNIRLPDTGGKSVEVAGNEFSYDLPLKSESKSAGPISLTLEASGKITVIIGHIALENVVLSGAFGSLVLEGLEVSFDAKGLQLSPLDLEGVTADEIKLVDQGSSPSTDEVKSSALFGGGGGAPFLDDVRHFKRLAKVSVRSGEGIDSLQATYELENGSRVEGARHGGTGGTERTLTLAPNEYIERIEGQFGHVVNQLRFSTNLGQSMAFGRFQGLYVVFQGKKIPITPGAKVKLIDLPPGMPDVEVTIPSDVTIGSQIQVPMQGKIQVQGDHLFRIEGHRVLGFHGRSGALLDAVGILYR